MTTTSQRFLFAGALSIITLFAFAQSASASSVVWTHAFQGYWYYYYNDASGVGYVRGLMSPTVQVSYHAEIIDEGTAALLPPGASVPTGTKLLLRFVPHRSEDIYWFGTGYSNDSPYGEWRANSAPPRGISCEEKDYVGKSANGIAGLKILSTKVYIPLVVAPPAHSMTGLDGLQCGALSDLGVGGAEMHCVAVNPGTVTPIFNMADTSGIFYYRYFLSGCMGHNIGMIYRPTTKGEMMYGLSMGQVPPDPVNVDAESIPYPLTIIPGSMPRSGEVNPYPPSTPVISGGSCQVGSPHSLSFTSTDPAGHQLKYGIDWDADGSIDQYVPPTGYVNSGTTQSASRTYSIAGQKQIRVVAINDHGMQSTWASKTFTCQVSACPSGYVRQGDRCVRSTQCTTPPHCEANDLVDSCTGETIRTCDWGCAAGACKAILAPSATLKAVPLLVHAGNTSSVSWTSFNTTSCTVSGANGDSWTGLSSTGKTSSPILSQTIYRLHCIGHAGANPPTIDKSVVINIIPSFNEK